MRRAVILLALLLAAAAPAWAQLQTRQTMQQVSASTCTSTACSATTAPYCVSGGPPATLHICNTSTGFYSAIASLPGGSTTQVQFNSGTAFAGDAGLTYNSGTDVLTVVGGVTVTAGPVSVATGQKVLLEGAAGDSYLSRDSDTGYVLVYIDGALRGTITPRGLIPGACGSDLWATEVGTACTDSLGRRIVVGADGPAVMTGSVP